MQDFTVNEFIKLRLENGLTQILVNNEYFNQCKYLLISLPVDRLEEWDGYESMDEIIKATTGGHGDKPAKGLAPEEAFQGHCSNLQAWAENGYDYRLLDTRLSIPIIMQIIKELLNKYNSKDPVLVNQKEYYKNKSRKFFFEIIKSLDDYMKSSLKNQYTYGKFKFLYKLLFRTKDKFFSQEEIEGSELLSKIYEHFLPLKQKEEMARKRGYWERKLWKRTPVVKGEFKYYVGDKSFYYKYKANLYSKRENLKYRKFLRQIRSPELFNTDFLLVSDPIDYLPYLYSMGKFTEENNIAWYEDGDNLFIRDENGYYWKEIADKWEGT